MSSKIIEALKIVGLLDKYKINFEEEKVDDWVVEQWLQDSSFNELKTVIPTSGDRMRFVRAFQQLPSISSNGVNIALISSPVPHCFNKSNQGIDSVKSPNIPETNNNTLMICQGTLENTTVQISLPEINNNSVYFLTSPKLPRPSTAVSDPGPISTPIRIPGMVKPKTMQEKATIYFLDNEFKSRMKVLQYNKYFIFINVKQEVEKIKTKLNNYLEISSPSPNFILKIEAELETKSTAMVKLNIENMQRRMEAEGQIEKIFEALCKSEFQRLKRAAQKSLPKPFLWVSNSDNLHRYYDSFLKSLVTPRSSPFDLQFQAQCREACRQKIESLLTATYFSSSVANEYSRQMRIEKDKIVAIATESEFTEFHETVLSRTFKSKNPSAHFPESSSKLLKNLNKSFLLDYGKMFLGENHRIKDEVQESAKEVNSLALQKYTQFMDQKTSQGSGMFEPSEISGFHKAAYNTVKNFFRSHPKYKTTWSWEIIWGKLEEKMKELEKEYQEKNVKKRETDCLQHLFSFLDSFNDYSLLNGSISVQSNGESYSVEGLENRHNEGKERAPKLYSAVKTASVREDTNKFREHFMRTALEAPESSILEADETMEVDEEEYKAREDERRRLQVKIEPSMNSKSESRNHFNFDVAVSSVLYQPSALRSRPTSARAGHPNPKNGLVTSQNRIPALLFQTDDDDDSEI